MRRLDDQEARIVKGFILKAAGLAEKSRCKKAKRGALIVKDGKVIGEGCNNPPLEEICDSCLREHIKDNSRTELCYGIHAEQNAMLDALLKENNLEGSTLYHVKIKKGKITHSGKPSCTQCSKLILRLGISEVVLLHEDGYYAYSSEEFNKKSFEYFLKT